MASYYEKPNVSVDEPPAAAAKSDGTVHTAVVSDTASELTQGEQDATAMIRAGKVQVLKRSWSLLSMLAFSCVLQGTWESAISAFSLGFTNGGPAGIIYGLIIAWLGTLSVFVAMGELASMITTAGGMYHWVSVLSPPSMRKFLSYITGWLTVTAWIAGTTAPALFFSGLLLNLVSVNWVDFEQKGWHTTLVTWAALLLSYTINAFFHKALPAIETAMLFIHLAGFIVILVPLVCLSPHNSPTYVFTTFQNGGGWETTGVSLLVGLTGNLVAFAGADGAVHMAEEVRNSPRNIPKAMVLSIVINGTLALGMVIAIVFCIQDPVAVSSSSFPIITILSQTLPPAGTAVLASMLICLQFFSMTASLAAASRMLWSFARDRGLPFRGVLSRVHRKKHIPRAALTTTLVTCLALMLIPIGSSTALGAIISLALEGLYAAYFLALALLLYRRVRGHIHPAQPETFAKLVRDDYTWGPWRVPGIWGVLNNIFGCAFLLVMATFSLFPQHVAPSPADMNWSSLMVGVVAIGSLVYYFVWARRVYDGPTVEVRH